MLMGDLAAKKRLTASLQAIEFSYPGDALPIGQVSSNGKLYDRVGIKPNVVLEATPNDRWRKSDAVIGEAVKHLINR